MMTEERRIVQMPTYLDSDGVLTCPSCGFQEFSVTNTGHWTNGGKKRRRECDHCGWAITTWETVDDTLSSHFPPKKA